MNPSADQLTRKIVPFGPSAGDKQSDELDRSGEAIISLLQQAADAARANEDRAATYLAQTLCRVTGGRRSRGTT